MSHGIYRCPRPINEPIRNYEPGSEDRRLLEEALNELRNEVKEIPLIIGGEKIKTDSKKPCIVPHDHQQVIGYYYEASEKEVQMAIDSALQAKAEWEAMPYKHRAAVFLKAADLLASKWRYKMNAATMLAQSKNVYQAEIDTVCELIDFYRFNAYYLEQIYEEQAISPAGVWNRMEYTALDGFVYAVSPFNFTSIGGNLAGAPALVGNGVVWKPASTAVYSNYMIMEILEEAGLPKGVINFVPGNAKTITDIVLAHPEFAGFHYTGSTSVFSSIWKEIGNNIQKYKAYPRIVGETGGKNFIFADESCDQQALAVAMVRGAYEYQGQKCSAASRVYVPSTIWENVKTKSFEMMETIKMGGVEDFKNFVNAVIDEKAFTKITSYIDYAKSSPDAEVIFGGGYDQSKGYFIEPTMILSKTTSFKTMVEEIFGPVLTVYVYDPKDFDATLEACINGTEYALTGAIFAQDRLTIQKLENALKHSAGNLYINDKPTGAVVGQQPFGGSKASGTNDKAGSKLNLFRWINTRAIKENFNPPHQYEYPFMS
ncbi:MAG: L-glutamate gamma-semialdehyde dehydrogenase [Clostridia bacterium]|nr:L-glutamate gamma-semialdehyde dehydrogenase [Clostridia bacterium]